MPFAYEKTRELDELIERLIDEHYADTLKVVGLKVSVLMAHSEDEQLSHRGRPVYAYIKTIGQKERALGQDDCVIVVDAGCWEKKLTEPQKEALIDHELYHVELKKDKADVFKFDDLNRPKFGMRPHDVEFGWFVAIARRHGDNSIERKQATAMLLEFRQDLFGIQMELPGFAAV